MLGGLVTPLAAPTAVSSTITKLKGTAVTCREQVDNIYECPPGAIRVWDTADYSPMGQETSAFFVTTNSVEVLAQRQCNGTWPEDPDSPISGTSRAWNCTTDADCRAIEFASSRNGAVAPVCNNASRLCDIYGWGPVETVAEDNRSQQPGYRNQLPGVLNLTVYIKNNIYFPTFKHRVRHQASATVGVAKWRELTPRILGGRAVWQPRRRQPFRGVHPQLPLVRARPGLLLPRLYDRRHHPGNAAGRWPAAPPNLTAPRGYIVRPVGGHRLS